MTVEATSDYDYRGETQTQKQPALQFNFEYSDPDVWKAGLFLSNVDFGNTCGCGDPRLEVNPSVEVSHRTDSGVLLGAGANYDAYTVNGGGAYDYVELNVDASLGGVVAWLSYAPDYDGHAAVLELVPGMRPSMAAGRLQGASLVGHAGFSWGPYWDRIGGGSKVDLSIGLSTRSAG